MGSLTNTKEHTMQAKNAAAILKLIGHLSLNDLRDAGAMEAVMELQEFASPEPARPRDIYIIVPSTEGKGTQKVSAIKTLRILYDLSLKQAKDAYEEAFVYSPLIYTEHGDAYRLGPFNDGNTEAAIAKWKAAREVNEIGCLNIEWK